MSNARAPRSRGGRPGAAASRTSDRCGVPGGCSRPAVHVVVEPVYGGRFGACEVHWPDLAGVIFAAGGWITGCSCAECIGA